MEPEAWQDLLEEMKQIDDTKAYYTLTLTADGEGNIVHSIQTRWVGFADEKRTQEICRPSLVKPYIMAKLWDDFGQPWLVVNKYKHLLLYLIVGGNALIEQSIAQQYLSELFSEDACVPSGMAGFVKVSSLPKQALNRAPTRKQRMRILKRDGFKCCLCGRRPENHVDVELHVHHIRPHSRGGLTEDKNLITLCHTCHKGLEPHEDYSLFGLVDPIQSADMERKEYLEGVHRYREAFRELQFSEDSEET